ncbi:hypothetical protein HYV79_01910, partial [Candidatus Woesearchaeota archaeon]|nr:hypothetical protein [Candidatus Woesearchaeota archaeon]
MRLRNIFFAWTLFLSGCPWMKRDTIIKEPEAEQQVVLEQPANPDQASNPIIQHEPLT